MIVAMIVVVANDKYIYYKKKVIEKNKRFLNNLMDNYWSTSPVVIYGFAILGCCVAFVF